MHSAITEKSLCLVKEQNGWGIKPSQLENVANHLFWVAPPLAGQAAGVEVEESGAAGSGQGPSQHGFSSARRSA